MKKTGLAIIIIGLALVVWGVWKHNQSGQVVMPVDDGSSTTTPTPGPDSMDDWSTYNDPQGGFSFVYPNTYTVTGRGSGSSTPTGWSNFSNEPGLVLSKMTMSKALFPGTNFSEAWFTVGWSNDPEAISMCTKNPGNGAVSGSDTVIDGTTYKKFTSSDAGAGNFYETTSYRAILDGDCYALEYVIHSTNIGNYDPSQNIKEFDKDKVKNTLDRIVKSFDFKVNSD